jgi:predicted Zn-dependent peptidase
MNRQLSDLEHDLPAGFAGRERRDALTGKVLWTFVHRSGFQVKVLPRPGFSRRFAAVTVPFGSISTGMTDGENHWQIPAGSAHFLEHCLFSRDEQGGLLGRMSALGASANAYTTHSHTLYYFSTVHDFAEGLGIYLDAIMNPQLDSERIDAERPIILAELDQYHDDPDSRSYMRLVESLYHHHPVRLDIGGTPESVAAITPEDLQRAWSLFYHPGRLTLTLAGDFDVLPILKQLDGRLARLSAGENSRQASILLPEEPPALLENQARLSMDVTTSSFLVGIKDPDLLPATPLTGHNLVGRRRAARLLFDTLLSPVSQLYETLYAGGLINDSFGFHYACEESFAFLACGGESDTPEESAAAVVDGLVQAFRQGIDPMVFESQKRAAAGDFVRALDSIEHSGMVQAQCSLDGVDLFDYPAIYDKMDHDTASRMMSFLADPANYATVILTPLEVLDNHER